MRLALLSCLGGLCAGLAGAATVSPLFQSTARASNLIAGTDGTLYGTSCYGGTSDDGTIFKISRTGVYQVLYNFTGGADGANPAAGLVFGTDGFLYGTCEYGGNGNAGSLFKITTSGAFTVLRTLNSIADGAAPIGGLVVGVDNKLYGTASSGGLHGLGVVFQISTGGSYAVLHSFSGADGQTPSATLTPGVDGLLYGVTEYGGANGYGAIFKISTGGAFTALMSFGEANGAYPAAPLVQGADQAFYGAATYGGAYGFGCIFKVTSGGAFTVLYSASQESSGSNPSAGLVFGAGGYLYGSTTYGGANGFGSIFQVTTAGAFTSLYNFTGETDGANPSTTMVRIGYFYYGTAATAGTLGEGIIYQLALLHFDSVQRLGNHQAQYSGSGGSPNGQYQIFTTTANVNSLPLSAWTPAGSGQFDLNGQFSFTAGVNVLEPKRMYFVQQVP